MSASDPRPYDPLLVRFTLAFVSIYLLGQFIAWIVQGGMP